MRDPKRIERVLNTIRQLWLTYPDLRLGQIMVNIVPPVGTYDDTQVSRLFYMEDDELEQRIKDFASKG